MSVFISYSPALLSILFLFFTLKFNGQDKSVLICFLIMISQLLAASLCVRTIFIGVMSFDINLMIPLDLFISLLIVSAMVRDYVQNKS